MMLGAAGGMGDGGGGGDLIIFLQFEALDVVMASIPQPPDSIRAAEPESGSRISDQKAEGGGCFGRGRGGVTQARLAQVVQLKRDSHLWCGWVQYGCLDVCEGTSMARTRVVNSV